MICKFECGCIYQRYHKKKDVYKYLCLKKCVYNLSDIYYGPYNLARIMHFEKMDYITKLKVPTTDLEKAIYDI